MYEKQLTQCISQSYISANMMNHGILEKKLCLLYENGSTLFTFSGGMSVHFVKNRLIGQSHPFCSRSPFLFRRLISKNILHYADTEVVLNEITECVCHSLQHNIKQYTTTQVFIPVSAFLFLFYML